MHFAIVNVVKNKNFSFTPLKSFITKILEYKFICVAMLVSLSVKSLLCDSLTFS